MAPDLNPNSSARPTTALDTLRGLELQVAKKRNPSMPDAYRALTKWNDKTANGLTKCVVFFLNNSGHFASRINSTGRFIQGQSVTDVIGHTRQFKGTWIKGTSVKGIGDVEVKLKIPSQQFAVPWSVEIKMKDKQLKSQSEYQARAESVGAMYSIVHSFEEFLTEYNRIMKL